MNQSYSDLPWNFEAFRRFLTFEVLRNAASVITLFDGTEIHNHKKLSEFQAMLNTRTGMTWEPLRQNSEEVLFSTEGNVFRNKARVLTSLFLLNPFLLKKGIINATDLSYMLSSGKMNEDEFYDFIFTRYQYPHPAFDENWAEWKSIGRELKPFLFIIQLLDGLYRDNPLNGYLTVDEFARFAHSNPNHEQVNKIIEEIKSYRKKPDEYPKRVRSDKVDRKINDIFGFLCMSRYVYYHGQNIVLNMVRKHPEENVYFYESRKGAQSAPEEISNLLKKGLK